MAELGNNASMANATYNGDRVDGHSIVGQVSSWGFQATAYQNDITKEVTIASAGTHTSLSGFVQDALADLGIGIHGWGSGLASKQLDHYVSTHEKFVNEMAGKYGELNLTGHSLGGYVAKTQELNPNVKSIVAFNAPGMPKEPGAKVLDVYSNNDKWGLSGHIHNFGSVKGTLEVGTPSGHGMEVIVDALVHNSGMANGRALDRDSMPGYDAKVPSYDPPDSSIKGGGWLEGFEKDGSPKYSGAHTGNKSWGKDSPSEHGSGPGVGLDRAVAGSSRSSRIFSETAARSRLPNGAASVT